MFICLVFQEQIKTYRRFSLIWGNALPSLYLIGRRGCHLYCCIFTNKIKANLSYCNCCNLWDKVENIERIIEIDSYYCILRTLWHVKAGNEIGMSLLDIRDITRPMLVIICSMGFHYMVLGCLGYWCGRIAKLLKKVFYLVVAQAFCSRLTTFVLQMNMVSGYNLAFKNSWFISVDYVPILFAL